MRHARDDYNRIQDPAGIIPMDEPVFLIRAQDVVSARVVEFWAEAAEEAGARPDIVQRARDWAAVMQQWRRKQVPDLPNPESGESLHDGAIRRAVDRWVVAIQEIGNLERAGREELRQLHGAGFDVNSGKIDQVRSELAALWRLLGEKGLIGELDYLNALALEREIELRNLQAVRDLEASESSDSEDNKRATRENETADAAGSAPAVSAVLDSTYEEN